MRFTAILVLFGLIGVSAVAAPKKVSPFSLPQMNHANVGTLYNSAEKPNAVFVVETYFLNCPYCNDNAPNVEDFAEKYQDDPRVQVLDVGVDKTVAQYESWIRRHSPNHPVLNDGNRILVRQLGTTGYPSTYVLDCRGNVLTSTSGVWSASKLAQIDAAVQKGLETGCPAN